MPLPNQQIYQQTSKSSLLLSDFLAVDDDSSSHVTWKVTGQNVVDLASANVVIAESQVTNLVTDLSNRFLISNNLSEGTPATMRTNLGLGQAAVKSVSNNAISSVASATPSSYTIGHILTAADVNGTIQDGGSTSQFLLAANNLSDVSSNTASFDHVSPLTAKGDLIVYDGTHNVRFAGSSTNNYVLTYDNTQPQNVKWAPVPAPGDVVRVISTATTLTAADFGKTIVCMGSSSYTVILPLTTSGAANQFIYFVFDTSQQVFVTIKSQVPDSFVGPGSNGITYGNGEGSELFSDGSGVWLIASQNLVPCNMSLGLAGTFTSSGTAQVIMFDNTVYKSNMNYNVVTGSIGPIYPGKYKIYCQLQAPTNATAYTHQLFFNFVSYGQINSNNYNNILTAPGTISLEYSKAFDGTGTGLGPQTFTPQYFSSTALTIGGSSSTNFIVIERTGNY